MKRTNRYRRERKMILEMLGENRRAVGLLALFALGVAWGCAAVKNGSEAFGVDLKTLFSAFVAARLQHSFFASLLSAMLPSLLLASAVFLSGLSPVGLPAAAVVPLFRGVGLGVVSGCLYQSFGLKGIAYCALVIYPHSVFSVTALVFCCLEAAEMSMRFAAVFRGEVGVSLSSEFKLYLARFAVFLCMVFFACVLDVFLSKAFSGFFRF